MLTSRGVLGLTRLALRSPRMIGARSRCFVQMLVMSWRCSIRASVGEMYDPMRIHCWFPDVRIADMVLGETGVGSLICQLSASFCQKGMTPPL